MCFPTQGLFFPAYSKIFLIFFLADEIDLTTEEIDVCSISAIFLYVIPAKYLNTSLLFSTSGNKEMAE